MLVFGRFSKEEYIVRGPAIWALFALALAACGPVEYISQVTRRASSEVAAAKAAGAEKTAPYEYTSAVLYLHKAREEAGYADFQAAIRFGKVAQKMAEKAKELAISGAGEAASRAVIEEPPTSDADGGAEDEDGEDTDKDASEETSDADTKAESE